jgi:A/G-specific adenine glycosylase
VKKSTPLSARQLRAIIYRHYRLYGRKLPWRRTRDPWRILVSEMMLQQTQVSRVQELYGAFVARFPTAKKCAAADAGEVQRLWQGLGYNRRARFLKEAASRIAVEHGGKVPSAMAELTRLSGIGKNTAAAIMAFAFDIPVGFIETNIRAVFLHFYGRGGKNVSDNDLMPHIEATLDRKDPRSWYYALMDYGVYLKKQYPLLSRQSAHYKAQSKFPGSRRQVRGAVMRVLASSRAAGITGRGLLSAVMREKAALREESAREAIAELEREKLIQKIRGRYCLS